MTHDELRTLALEFMVEHYGRPISLDEDAREQWHRDLGLIFNFANTIFIRVATMSNSPNRETAPSTARSRPPTTT